MLFKAPQSLSGLGLTIFSFTRKLPSDVFSGGMPARVTISSIQGDSDLKAYFSRRKLAEVCLAFDFKNGMNTAGGHFYFRQGPRTGMRRAWGGVRRIDAGGAAANAAAPQVVGSAQSAALCRRP